MSKKVQNWAVPLIAVLLRMLIGAVLMLIFGYDPFWAYYDLFSTAFGSLKNIGEILRAMSPLILIALGFSVASKAGFFTLVCQDRPWQDGFLPYGLLYHFLICQRWFQLSVQSSLAWLQAVSLGLFQVFSVLTWEQVRSL